MVDVRVKPLEWSEVRQPDDEIRYTHVVADSPIGRWSIEWKGWKDYDDRTVFLDGEFILNGGDDLEEAQSATLARYESIIRSTLSDAVAEREAEPVAWLRDLDGTGSLHPAAKGDPGAFPVYTSPPTSELEALRKRVAEIDDHRRKILTENERLLNALIERDRRVAELEKALEWYEDKVADCRKLTKEGDSARADLDHDGGKLARRVLEGGKVE